MSSEQATEQATNGAEKAAPEQEASAPAPAAAAVEPAMVIEQQATPPVVLAEDEKALLCLFFGDQSQVSVTVAQCGTVHRLRVKLGLEPK